MKIALGVVRDKRRTGPGRRAAQRFLPGLFFLSPRPDLHWRPALYHSAALLPELRGQ